MTLKNILSFTTGWLMAKEIVVSNPAEIKETTQNLRLYYYMCYSLFESEHNKSTDPLKVDALVFISYRFHV